MIKNVIKFEDELQSILDRVTPPLSYQNVKTLIIEMSGMKNWDEIKEKQYNSKLFLYPFLDKENYLEIYRIINMTCIHFYNIPDCIVEISRQCSTQGIIIDDKHLKKYICYASLCGLIDLKLFEAVNLEDSYSSIYYDRNILFLLFIVENILCNVYENGGSNIRLSDISMIINRTSDAFLYDYILYNISRIQERITIINAFENQYKNIGEFEAKAIALKKELEDQEKNVKNELQKTVDERVENIMHDFHGRMIEIIGLFIAIFALIGFNLFENMSTGLYGIIVTNLSCLLSIVTIFFLIQKVIKQEKKTGGLIFAIIVLAFSIVIVYFIKNADLEVFFNHRYIINNI